MPTFGEVIIDMILTVIFGIVNTVISVLKDFLLLFGIVIGNMEGMGFLTLFLAIVILGIIIIAIFKLLKAESKTIFFALLFFLIVILLALFLL